MTNRDTFGSRFAAIATLAGSAIGLGGLWRFPYVTGQCGGAVFVLLYVLFSLLFCVPIFAAEAVIGRRSGSNCLGAMRKLAPHSWWQVLGALSIITPLIILSYYCVVGGWSLEFFAKSLSLSFVGVDPSESSGIFRSFVGSVWAPAICFTLFLAITCLIVAFGVKKGIELFSKISIPALFVIVIVVMIYALCMPGAGKGVEYLIHPDWSKLSFRTVAIAMGQSFYSLSLGMGIMITYTSYMDKGENIIFTGTATAFSTIAFSLIAGFAIMPAVFAGGMEPSSGPGLLFETLPYIFSEMCEDSPILSSVAAILFFLGVVVAALTSSISLAEVGVAYLVEEKKIKRPIAALYVFIGVWILGMLCSLSCGPAKSLSLWGKPLFDFLDMFCSNFLLTIGALLAVLFAGWKLSKADVMDEITNSGTVSRTLSKVVYFIIKYVAPIVIIAIFISNLAQ